LPTSKRNGAAKAAPFREIGLSGDYFETKQLPPAAL